MIRRWHDSQRARLRQALNHPAPTNWENLGLWSAPDQPYAEAARALAMRVGQAAGLQRGDAVLDIGPGVGPDQQQLWGSEFGIGDYFGWERDTPPPPSRTWQHVLAVDSAYFLPDLWQRWQDLWPRVAVGGSITWTDFYLAKPAAGLRTTLRLRVTSALALIAWNHWRTRQTWLGLLAELPQASVHFEDLTEPVLSGFVKHMRWRQQAGLPRTGMQMADGTAALLEPLLAQGVIGYGLIQVHKTAA